METVLVLPVYLALLGGLFIVGDVLVGRLRLSSMDRLAAWRGDSPHQASVRDVYAGRIADPDDPGSGASMILDEARTWALDPSADPDGTASGGGSAAVELAGNGWADLVYGRADAEVDVPFWVGAANAPLLSDPDAAGRFRFQSRAVLYPGMAGGESGRVFLVRRRTAPDPAVPRRDATAAALATTWAAVVADPLPGLRTAPAVASPAGDGAGTYVRHPVAVALGE
ncbi:MAG: hypothetical protein IJV65_02550 [Kiritimatiellae bacterium]|nr:hypothetical protein [Kiritimatiellia bacterium]